MYQVVPFVPFWYHLWHVLAVLPSMWGFGHFVVPFATRFCTQMLQFCNLKVSPSCNLPSGGTLVHVMVRFCGTTWSHFGSLLVAPASTKCATMCCIRPLRHPLRTAHEGRYPFRALHQSATTMSLSRRQDRQLSGVVTRLARLRFGTSLQVGLSSSKWVILPQVRGHVPIGRTMGRVICGMCQKCPFGYHLAGWCTISWYLPSGGYLGHLGTHWGCAIWVHIPRGAFGRNKHFCKS